MNLGFQLISLLVKRKLMLRVSMFLLIKKQVINKFKFKYRKTIKVKNVSRNFSKRLKNYRMTLKNPKNREFDSISNSKTTKVDQEHAVSMKR